MYFINIFQNKQVEHYVKLYNLLPESNCYKHVSAQLAAWLSFSKFQALSNIENVFLMIVYDLTDNCFENNLNYKLNLGTTSIQ
jgi:hypothetical protein